MDTTYTKQSETELKEITTPEPVEQVFTADEILSNIERCDLGLQRIQAEKDIWVARNNKRIELQIKTNEELNG